MQIEPDASYFTKLQSRIAGGTAPDVAVMDSTRFPEFVAAGNLEVLDPLAQSQTDLKLSDYLPATVHAFQAQGATYALPYDVSVLGVAYNLDDFELAYLKEPAPNWTWQDYLKYAKALTRDSDENGGGKVWGTATPAWWQVNVWENGGDLVDDPANPQRSTLSTPAAQQALQYVADLSLKEKVAPPASTPAAAQPLDAFCAGRLAMMYATHADLPRMNKASDLRWGTLPLPRGKVAANLGLTSGFCLIKGSKHEKEAWKLMAFLAGVDGQKLLLEGGMTTPALQALVGSEYFGGVGATGGNPYAAGLKIVHPLPVTPHYAEIAAVWAEEFKPLWTGQATVAQVTARIDQRVDQILQQSRPATAWLFPLTPLS